VIKRGVQDGVQVYKCKKCGVRFRNERREKVILEKYVWFDFVFKKQVHRELVEKYHLDKRTIHSFLEKYVLPIKAHTPRALFVVVDATYFRKQKNTEPWCVVVFRDPIAKENLWWGFGEVENHNLYSQGRAYLESLGYVILGVTGDGISCLRKVFFDIPFQMCLVHMERIVIRKITRKPKLEAGIVFLALIKTLGHCPLFVFKERFKKYIEKYRDFLNEKSFNSETGIPDWTHRELRSAVQSLQMFLPYLFSYEKTKELSQTTNSLEGHFSHVKDIVRIHRGISTSLLRKVLSSIFLVSTIAPKNRKRI
jgi:hypothetical protein